jgi:hypothetical protein
MNKKVSLIFLCIVFNARAVQECASHMFVPRSITTDLVYVNALNFYRRHHQDTHKSIIYTATALYQNNRKSSALGSALLLGNGSNRVTVAQEPPADINSAWLNLTGVAPLQPFSGSLSIEPRRKVFGYHAHWYFNLNTWWHGLWADISTAVVNVRHSLNCEEISSFANGAPGIQSISDALSNPAYKFGKFFCGLCDDEKRRTGIDDVQVRLGYNYTWCDNNQLGIYAIATVPTGRKPTAEFVFEPLVGSRHASGGVGLILAYQFDWCNCGENSQLTLLSDFNYRYVFSAHECRTFDLTRNGPFSRFLLVSLADNPSAALPGINFFTQKVNIQPRGTIQWWLALNYECCAWDFEVGYNLFWRQKERIKNGLMNPGYDIGVFDLGCTDACTSSSTATIGSYSITSDPAFVTINNVDFNPASAVAGRVISNKVYAALATDGCWCDCINWFAGFGGSYEFVDSHDRCNALQYWAVFGKGGISF